MTTIIVTEDNEYMFFIGNCSPEGFFAEHKITLWEGIEFVRITQDVFGGTFTTDGKKMWVSFPHLRPAMSWHDHVVKYFCPTWRSRVIDEKKI